MDHRLVSGDPDVWNSAVTAANPASILVAIGCRMGEDLRQRLAPEDVWQETLLKAWQARADFEWQAVATFRPWLLRIGKHCIEDHRDRDRAKKRDSRRMSAMPPTSRSASGSSTPRDVVEPWGSTTPSRIAVERERAQAMEKALRSLPNDVRDVVRLRLFDDLPIAEIATTLGIGESAVRHRSRAGAELYRVRVQVLLEATSVSGRVRSPEKSQRGGEPETRDGSAAGFRYGGVPRTEARDAFDHER